MSSRAVRVGDVVGVQFSGEDELVLFIPHSGDVLLCPAIQWRSLLDRSDLAHGPVAGSMLVSDLRSTLFDLGAHFA